MIPIMSIMYIILIKALMKVNGLRQNLEIKMSINTVTGACVGERSNK